ncbi:MAG TPA: nuclear transport factor 2 family protein [Gemmatimonadaceae bacterium]|nr:nuclear transport factor 2 family protein [Gemmatimonadaceae bacterium]
MLAASARAWNRGDLDAFVADYLDSDRTTFITRSGVLHGRSAIRAVYAPRFAPGGERDSLSFEGLEVDSLAPGVINVIAQYVLSRGDSTVERGPTSLVMLRVDGRWRIVHDHSS